MKVWFNRGLSNTYDALLSIRASDAASAFVLRATHTDPLAAVAQAADEFAVEPTGLGDGAYVEWCLGQCREHGVDLFVPQRRREAVSARRAAFGEIGVRLSVMGDATTLAMVDQKHELYRDLAGSGVPVPPYRVFRTVTEFDTAIAELEPVAGRVCVKPCVGVYGAGFRILDREGCDFSRLLSGDTMHMSLKAFRTALAESAQNRDMMISAYLPGDERSVDILAHRGQMIRAVARVKVGTHQLLETTGPSVDMAAFLTDRYGLDGVFNLQTREKDGIQYLLEINSRMSGGLLYACLSGIAFPYWNLMLTAGLATPEDVPLPAQGVAVAAVQGCLAVSPAPLHTSMASSPETA
ncbi:ATP-grasp domain-containing protein [Insolitispirillum peregrinum]|uniref:ATP-grasp domain-containing protein n=1 Tax=Insolitispirillum peregrinum TaxID=80876 RepID=UPI00361E3295